MTYHVTIVNGVAQEKAYAEDRRPRPDEAQRRLVITAPTMSHLNGIVQERMMAEGFERNDWKILGYEESAGDEEYATAMGGLLDAVLGRDR